MPVTLDYVHEGDWAAVQRLVDKLTGLLIDTGNQTIGIRFGAGTVTFSASATSSTTTVAHGLGRTPIAAFTQGVGGTAFAWLQVISFDATNLVVQSHDVDNVARTGSNTFYWAVIG